MKLAQIKKELDLLHIERKRLVNAPQSADSESRISDIQKQIDALLAAKVEARGASEIITRFAHSFIRDDGKRRITHPTINYGHPDEAKESLASLVKRTRDSDLEKIFGEDFINTVRIDPIQCRPHGLEWMADSLFIDDPDCPFQKKNPDYFK